MIVLCSHPCLCPTELAHSPARTPAVCRAHTPPSRAPPPPSPPPPWLLLRLLPSALIDSELRARDSLIVILLTIKLHW